MPSLCESKAQREKGRGERMTRAIEWTPKMDTKLFELRGRGMPFENIAEVIGVSPSAAFFRCRTIGAAHPPKPKTTVTQRAARSVEQHKREQKSIPTAPARYVTDGYSWDDPLPPGHELTWGAISMGMEWPNRRSTTEARHVPNIG